MPNTRSAQLKDKLADVRDYLQGLAEWAEWATSGKAWMAISQYQDWKRRELIKEKKEMLYELKRRKWIEIKTIGNRVVTRLTDQGWERALRDKIRNEKKRCRDGVCIITFDIPESQRFVRNLLRKVLKEWGFTKLQHSVWMTDKDVVAPLLLLLQRRKLDRWIHIIHGRVLTPSPFHSIRTITKKVKKLTNT